MGLRRRLSLVGGPRRGRKGRRGGCRGGAGVVGRDVDGGGGMDDGGIVEDVVFVALDKVTLCTIGVESKLLRSVIILRYLYNKL